MRRGRCVVRRHCDAGRRRPVHSHCVQRWRSAPPPRGERERRGRGDRWVVVGRGARRQDGCGGRAEVGVEAPP